MCVSVVIVNDCVMDHGGEPSSSLLNMWENELGVKMNLV